MDTRLLRSRSMRRPERSSYPSFLEVPPGSCKPSTRPEHAKATRLWYINVEEADRLEVAVDRLRTDALMDSIDRISFRSPIFLGNVIRAAWKGLAYSEGPDDRSDDEVSLAARISEHSAHLDEVDDDPEGPFAERHRRIAAGLVGRPGEFRP
jgi:hypothetical protein